MIFIANVLTMNGGSTFLIRACREMKRRGQKPIVLILINMCDSGVFKELKQVANIVMLRDFLCDGGRFFRYQLGVFGPVDWSRLVAEISPSGSHVHVMGSFGLLFARRLAIHMSDITVSTAVYHQNEFLFRKIPWFIARECQSSFASLDAESVVFFNTASKNNYAKFFDKDYSLSPVLPIGVEVTLSEPIAMAPAQPPKIVSIGNLVPFKTYNRHVITVLASLKESHPDVCYEIYGAGSERQALESYANQLGVASRVIFKGVLPYADFAVSVRDAALFVGSGTALIEAADQGIPALIGIESSNAPITYGFLNMIDGFSYNEDNVDLPRVKMEDCIVSVLNNLTQRTEIGLNCRTKAKEFSIVKTVDGFDALQGQLAADIPPLGQLKTAYTLLSFIGLGIFEKITGRKIFSDRRSQSY